MCIREPSGSPSSRRIIVVAFNASASSVAKVDCGSHPTLCVTVSSVERRGGGGGEPFLVFGILVERRDIRSSYHPLRVALNFFHGDSILRGFMLFVIESGSLRYMWNIRKRNRGTCARSTIAIRDVEVHVKGNLERSTRNASYFYIYINRVFFFFPPRSSWNFAEKVNSTFRSARSLCNRNVR